MIRPLRVLRPKLLLIPLVYGVLGGPEQAMKTHPVWLMPDSMQQDLRDAGELEDSQTLSTIWDF